MSKEAHDGSVCACGVRFAFPEYHWPHCPTNPNNLSGGMRKALETKFSKAEVESIAKSGPVRDQVIQRKGKRRKLGAKL